MSQMFGRILKLSSSSSIHEKRLFSTAATPYMLLRKNIKVISWEDRVTKTQVYNPRTQETVEISEQSVPKEIHQSRTVGSSRGWVGLKNFHDSTVRLTNMFNPSTSPCSRKVITLPPLLYDASLSNLALSASPDEQGSDCVVAVKFFGPKLALCRPGDSEWTYIETPENFTKVMYSVRDQKFYLNAVPEAGPITSSSKFPPVSSYPTFPGYLDLHSETSTPYLVETPSGESLVVYWVRKSYEAEKLRERNGKNTKSFVVQELSSKSTTRDIGDLRVFLGKNEPFCVSATDYPGLRPNSVYFGSFDSGFGFYDLTSLTLHDLTDSVPDSIRYMWLAPLH